MSDVTATAAVIARVRAEESARPAEERLFTDPFAYLFTCGETSAAIAARFGQVPFFREQVLLRTRFIDETLAAALADGMRQVLLLGAGFDCRALRLSPVRETCTRVFEVDLAIQLEQKRAILQAAGYAVPAWDVFIACDFGTAGFEATLERDLAAAGYDRAAPVFVVWEGVVNYLEPAAIERTFRFIARDAARGTQVVFNYATYRLDPASLPARLAALGYRRVETWTGSTLHRRYYGTEPAAPGRLVADEFLVSRAVV